MRLIDADKLYPDRMTNKGTVAISQSQIAKAPTVQAIPIDVFDKIRAEIEQVYKQEEPIDHTWAMGLRHSLKIINKYRRAGEEE